MFKMDSSVSYFHLFEFIEHREIRMKIFALATLVVSSVFVAADLSAEEVIIPWHWDDVVYVEVDEQTKNESVRKAEEYSDLGW
jgi:hypothetical protein